MCGLTTGRASQAWHFLRRDIVQNKTKALVNKRCFEDEFSTQYLNEESDTEESFDSDTSYENEDESDEDSNLHHVFPFQLSNKGWVTPGSLEHVKLDLESRNKKPSPLPSLSEEISIDMLLESEIAMTRTNSVVTSPLPSPNLTTQKPDTQDMDSEKIMEKLVTSFEIPLEIIKEPETKTESLSATHGAVSLTDSLLDLQLIDYFSDRPAHVRCIKRVKRRRTLTRTRQSSISSHAKKNPVISMKTRDSRTSVYDGLCKLVTVLNRTKGKYVDNSKGPTLFDQRGKEWRNKDLPSYLNINTDKYMDPQQSGFRQKKKNVDTFVTELPVTTSLARNHHVNNRPKKIEVPTPATFPASQLPTMIDLSTTTEPAGAYFTNLTPSIVVTDSLNVKPSKEPTIPSATHTSASFSSSSTSSSETDSSNKQGNTF